MDAYTQLFSNIRGLSTKKWVKLLPEKLLDKEAFDYLSSAEGDPTDLVTSFNPFAMSARVSDVTTSLEAVTRLRAEALVKEALLYGEILAEGEQFEKEKHVAEIMNADYKKNLKLLGQEVGDEESPVSSVIGITKKYRDQRSQLREIPGHPLNLLEQSITARKRYIKELAILLAKAEGIRLVIGESFPFKIESILAKIVKSFDTTPNPIPLIAQWIRDLLLSQESSQLGVRLVTIYRLLEKDGWSTDGIEKQIQNDNDVSASFHLSRTNLRLDESEHARMIAIGVAPVFEHTGVGDKVEEAGKFLPYVSNARSMRRQLSFDLRLEFESLIVNDPVSIDEKPPVRKYAFPKVIEEFNGVQGWGAETGSASNAIPLRQVPLWTNRAHGGKVLVTLSKFAKHHHKTFPLTSLLDTKNFSETTIHDIAVGVQYIVYKKSVT